MKSVSYFYKEKPDNKTVQKKETFEALPVSEPKKKSSFSCDMFIVAAIILKFAIDGMIQLYEKNGCIFIILIAILAISLVKNDFCWGGSVNL